jgi:uracil-DNA glycosylase
MLAKFSLSRRSQFLLKIYLCTFTRAHKAGSHSKIGWETFTDRVISLVSQKNNGCAFVLWGNFAQRKEGIIDKKKHKIIKSAHPSPFSMTRFFGSKPFSQANSYLKSIGKKPVNWSLV